MTDITDSPTFDAHTATMTENHPTDARFWKRAYANFVDGIIISLLGLPIVLFSIIFFIYNENLFNYFLQMIQRHSIDDKIVGLICVGVYFVLTIFISAIYYCYYLSSKAQATPGMKLHGLKLVNAQGNRPSFIQVFLRELISIISFWGLFIGYLMILFTKRRQALHDMATLTYVQDYSDDSKAEILISQYDQNFIYGGFWRRVGAYCVDGILSYALCFGLAALIVLGDHNIIESTDQNMIKNFKVIQILGFTFSYYIAPILYYILFTSSKFQATPGKMLFSLKVLDDQGNRLTIFKSFIRYYAEFFYSFFLFIGFIMVAFTKRKQGLHDKIARTYVIRVSKKAVGNNI